MRLPLTFGHLHIRKYGGKGRVFRRAGIDAELNLSAALVHMADTHLIKMYAVGGALDTIVIFSSAETVPHGFDGRVNDCRRPVGVSVVGHDTAQVLELFIFVFDGAFHPVFAIQIHDNPALVKTMMAVRELGLYDEAEILLLCLHLQNRSVIIAEMIIRSLPQISVRLCGDLNSVLLDFVRFWFSDPAKCFCVHTVIPPMILIVYIYLIPIGDIVFLYILSLQSSARWYIPST